jgi:hypothetical protein
MKKLFYLLIGVMLLTSCESEYKKQARKDLKEAQENLKRLNFQTDSIDAATELRHRRNELNY